MSASETAEPRSAFTTSAPAFGIAEIEALVAERYGIEAEASLLTSERDLTVRLDVADGRRFVLKIANAAEDPAVSAFQNRALEHIERTVPDVPASRLVRTLAGEAEFLAERGGERHVTRLLTWLPGRPLFGAPRTPRQMRSIGTSLGRLASGLSSFSHPAAVHEIVWDIRRSPGLMERTRHISDPVLRARVEAIFAGFRDEIAPREPGLRAQVVHNDFNPFNLLVDEAETDRITGILDFGDLVETCAIYDLAVASAYQVSETGHPFAAIAELVAAYHAVHPVPVDELDLLPDLVGVRQAMTITIGEWRASRYPENAAYILRNHAKAKASLDRCSGVSRQEARAMLRRACGWDA
ncbi:phosphotransferase [Aureimonas sp. AU22]|uniref:phosphotransferase n=1 Tax=Aureimonas sp. AU22 TaxID=1638162 RepID=UPI0007855358|nr:phosphotransferase [Aureimonas sp. AU22]